MRKTILLLIITALVSSAALAQETTPEAEIPAGIFFDDFSYTGTSDPLFTGHGWIVRTEEGWPGVPGAFWNPDGVSVVDDPENAGNRLMQMVSTTDGREDHTTQTQFCQQRKFHLGTYAALVRFSDAPESGLDGDQIVQTFYVISPLEFELDPNYSELDFEYLPNGGWGTPANTFFVTSWETFRPDPNWLAVNESSTQRGSLADGWHMLTMQVTDEAITYYLDDVIMGEHGSDYVPEVPMSINFNLWFINGGLNAQGRERAYVEQIDWVFHAQEAIVMPEEIMTAVAAFREGAVTFNDSVPVGAVALESPCNF